jgi:hypothetical protein
MIAEVKKKNKMHYFKITVHTITPAVSINTWSLVTTSPSRELAGKWILKEMTINRGLWFNRDTGGKRVWVPEREIVIIEIEEVSN